MKVRISIIVFTLFVLAGESAVSRTEMPGEPAGNTAIAIFAGGCFWSMQKLFDHLSGVVATTVGYTGGTRKNPTYEDVSYGDTGHLEAVKVVYDPRQISYEKLLNAYWHDIDPTTLNQAFCDTGPEYSSAIFYTTDEQKRAAEISKEGLTKTKPFAEPLLTAIRAATNFYAAEDYHQEFYKKNPVRYEMYKLGCRRDRRLQQLWGNARD